MPIYISHSPNDKQIADELAIQLAHRNVNIWIDQWQLAKDDSLRNKIQEDIHGTSALLVVLSKETDEAEWCRKDLSPLLLRELEEGKNIVVMPVIIEDCAIPEWARGKVFADLRTNSDDGLCTIIEEVAKVTNPMQARVIQHNYNQDWAIEWRVVDGRLIAIFTYVLMHHTLSFSSVITIHVDGNQAAAEMYEANKVDYGVGVAKLHVAKALNDYFDAMPDVVPTLSDSHELFFRTSFSGFSSNEDYSATVSVRTVGDDPGRDIPVDLKGLVERTYKHMAEVLLIGIKCSH
jgi:hypothetical protein